MTVVAPCACNWLERYVDCGEANCGEWQFLFRCKHTSK